MSVAGEILAGAGSNAAVVPLDAWPVLEGVGDGAFLVTCGPAGLELVHATRRLRASLAHDPESPLALSDFVSAASLADIERALTQGGEFRGDCSLRSGAGTALWGRCIARWLVGAQRDPARALVTVTDITGEASPRTAPEFAIEAERRTTQARFEALAESAQDMIHVIDSAGFIVYSNAATERCLGWAPEALAGQRSFDYVHPDDLPIARERFGLLMLDPASFSLHGFRYRARHADGSWRWLDVLATNALENPAIRGILLHCRDVTDRQRAEAELAEARAQLEVALSAGQIGIWSVDMRQRLARSRLMHLELAAQAMPHGALTDEDWMRHIHPDDLPRVQGSLFSLRTDESSWGEVEFRLPVRDGSWHWCLARGRVTERLPDGSAARVDGILLDIDRRRQTEQALAASEFRYRAVAALTPGFTHEAALTPEGTLALTWVSDGAREVFGCRPEEILALGWTHFLVQRDGPAHLERMAQYRNGNAQTFEACIRDIPGRIHWLRISNRPVWNPDTGQVVGVVGVCHDITEEKRLQQEILEISHREQQRIGNDLHDGLGQELTGAAMLLREITTRLRGEAPEMATRIDDVIGLVNGAIESARLLARGLSPVGLVGGSLVEALRELARTASARFGVDVSFRNMSPPTFDVDDATAVHLYRIAQEAISNAVRHGRASRIRVTLSGRDGDHRLSIRDHGSGMEAAMPRGARGMGLKIMAYRASMIGGAITVRSREQHGVLVRCSFPQRPRPG